MKTPRLIPYLAALCIGASAVPGVQQAACPRAVAQQLGAPPGTRERLLMDAGWRFAFGHAYDPSEDFRHGTGYFSYVTKAGYGDGPAAKNFDDRSWRVLDLPHDWAAELPFDADASYSHGYKTVGRGYPGTSVGWYRRAFSIPASDLGRRICIEFDGVHRNSIVWVNGFYLGEEQSGYYGFRYDITDYLDYGGENVIAVRADATLEEGWYYEGAGIYRHVWLTKTAPLHVAPWGTFVSSEVSATSASVTARTNIVNEGSGIAHFEIEQSIVNARDAAVARKAIKHLALAPRAQAEFSCVIPVTRPALWSIEHPSLYTLVTTVRAGGSVVDRYETPFGIRTIRFDPDEGIFINGKHLQLRGTNNHQDHAGVGTAIPDALQEFRVRRLKEMGSNAYRCSHNPPTPELLDICDRLGMLVIDENRLMGTTPELLEKLKKMILRDRNHPSVFTWSIGNEEWSMEGTITGARVASTMQAYARQLDPTRRVIAATSGGWGSGISTVIDIIGFNYIFNGDIDKQHADFPLQPSIGTEETTSRGTRGVYDDDPPNAHMKATDRTPSGRSMETGFKFYAARPFLSGLFFWTGFDYRGEASPYGWPQVASQCGIVDLCGFPKDMFYYLASLWTEAPVLHLLPHWNWRGREGQTISVWAYSNCDEVELFLNDRTLGRKPMPENSHLEWNVAFEPGVLSARGYRNGAPIVTDTVETTGEPALLRLIPDRSVVNADAEDVSVVRVEVLDARGRIVPTACSDIAFSVQGPGRIIGVGNGDPSSHEPDRYIPRVSQIPIKDLKGHEVGARGDYPETGTDFNDSAWAPAMNGKGEYAVRTSDTLKNVVIRGTFMLPDITDSTVVSLWPKSLGEEQAVYVNGHRIAENMKRDDAVRQYALDHAILRRGRNTYAMVGSPLVKRFQYDNLNTDPGIVGCVAPPDSWKRRAFNGLAQVIVQSEAQPGEISLKATSGGLSPGVVVLRSLPARIRPSVK